MKNVGGLILNDTETGFQYGAIMSDSALALKKCFETNSKGNKVKKDDTPRQRASERHQIDKDAMLFSLRQCRDLEIVKKRKEILVYNDLLSRE